MNLRNRLMGGSVACAPNTDAGAETRPAGVDGQVQQRMARFIPTTYDATTRSVEAIFSTGARRQTWYGFEELDVSPEACDISRVGIGQVKALDHHNDRQINAIVGTVPEARFEGGNLVGRIVFAETDLGRLVEGMVARGELSGISCGYTIEAMEIVGIDEGRDIWRVTRWTLCEVSFVSVPADANAGVRSAGQSPGDPASATPPQETTDMRHRILGGVASAALNANTDHGSDPAAAAAAAGAPPVQTEQRAGQPAPVVPPAGGAQPGINLADGLRLLDTAATFGEAVQTEIRSLIADPNQNVASVERAMLFAAARAQATQTGHIPAGMAGRTGDTDATDRDGMVDALVSRMTGADPTDNGRRFRGMRLAQMMAVRNGITSHDEVEIYSRSVGMQTTSDFPLILGTAANRVMLDAYRAAPQVYRSLSRRRSFADFKPHAMIRGGEVPNLKKLAEGGEIKHGALKEGGESVRLDTYGLNISLSRQAIVNNDLGTFSDMAAQFGRSASRTEEQIAFAVILSNSGNGPKMGDGKTFFHADHGNVSASGADPSEATLDAAYQAYADQKNLDGDPMGYEPGILLVGPKLRVKALKLVTPITPATQADAVVIGQNLTVVIAPWITDKSWRLFTDPADLPAFVYGFLQDNEAPQVEQFERYNQDGITWKALHDFGFGAVNAAAGFKNGGAA